MELFSTEFVATLLEDYIKGLSDERLGPIQQGIVTNLDKLHSLGVVHGDIKGSNVFVVGGNEADKSQDSAGNRYVFIDLGDSYLKKRLQAK
jgi:serine/threonine protein kinase